MNDSQGPEPEHKVGRHPVMLRQSSSPAVEVGDKEPVAASSPRSLGLRIGAAVVVGVVLILSLVVARASVTGGASVAGAGVNEQTTVYRLPGPVYNLAYDSNRGRLWFSYMDSKGADYLYSYGAVSGKVEHWELPETAHNGFLERVAIAPDDAIWLTEDYTVIRLDSSLASMATVQLALDDPNASPDALSPDANSPGTWPSALAFDQGGTAMVARHNVSSLSLFDGSMHTAGSMPLPHGLYGVSALAYALGATYVSSYAGHTTVVLTSDGITSYDLPAGFSNLGVSAGDVWAPETGGGALLVTPAAVNESIRESGPVDQIAANTAGAVAYDAQLGTLSWFSATSPEQPGRVLALPVGSTQIRNPSGGDMVTALVSDSIGAIAMDDSGGTWYVDNTTGALVRVEP